MKLISVLALLPVALAAAAGGSQAPPPLSPTESMPPAPTVATIITINGTYVSNAPLPATTPLTYPLLNTSAITTNNLSSTSKKPTSSSLVLITTSEPGGQQSTITSFVGAPGEPTPTAGAGGSTPSGGTQPGSAGRIGEGKAIAALVAFGGAVAMLL